MNTRTRLIATLFVLEVAIFGAIVYLLGGTTTHAASVDYGGNRVIGVVDAGSTPHVVVSDPDSRVVVSASSDGRIHVIDRSRIHGWIVNGPKEYPVPQIVRTADGVKIERSETSGTHIGIIGESIQRIEIAVPPGANVEVQRSSGTDASGLQGALRVRSQDGHITLSDLHGPVDAQTDDGSIEASNVQASTLALSSKDGHLALTDVTTAKLTATTNDGHITLKNVHLEGDTSTANVHTESGHVEFTGRLSTSGNYAIASDDGHISLNVPGATLMALHAQTEDGAIRIDGRKSGSGDGDGVSSYDAAGTAPGKLNLSTQSGSITINTMGVN